MTTATMEVPAEVKKGKSGASLVTTAGNLRDALTSLSPALAGSPAIPVLKTVRFEATEDSATLTASNLEMSIRSSIPNSGGEARPFLVNSDRLLNYVKLLRGDNVTLTPSDSRMTMKCEKAVTKFPTMSASNFPLVNFGVGDNPLSVKQSTLLDLLRYTAFAMSEEESRYTLKAALVEVGDGRLSVVTTDGHRLSCFSVPYDGAKVDPLLLPGDLVHALQKTVEDSSDLSVRIGATEEAIGCEVDGDLPTSITHRKMVGTFPNYKAVIPSGDMAVSIEVEVDGLLESLKRCVAMADEKTECVKLSISESRLVMKAVDPQAGETIEDLEISASKPFAEFSTGFCGSYLTDVLNRLDGTCTLQFKEANGNGALKITATTEDGGELVHVVMPMRI
jgi:DNA polymerase III subunit beta